MENKVLRRVVICGSRDWEDFGIIRKLLEKLPEDTTVVVGGARGADRLAEREARAMGFEVEVYPADWDKHGKAAGYRRNELMAALPNVTHTFAFRLGEVSRGTDHMVEISEAKGIYTKVVESLTRPGKEQACISPKPSKRR